MLDFGETYEEELPRVYGYVAYQVASQEEAEDLTQQTFELIALRYGADLSGPQIASVTGLTVANVQQILSRSLRRLRAELEHGSRKRPRIGPVENESARG